MSAASANTGVGTRPPAKKTERVLDGGGSGDDVRGSAAGGSCALRASPRTRTSSAAEARAVDGLRPVLLEYAFGSGTGRPAFAIPAPGGDVLLQGRIDRVLFTEALIAADHHLAPIARERLVKTGEISPA